MPEPTSAEALIFDMDGVLIDSEPLWRRAEIEVFAEVGLALSESDCLRTQGLRIDEAVAFWFERAPWSGRPCEEVARAISTRVAELIREDSEPLPGVHASIEAARSHSLRLGLASSSSGFLIETVLDHFGLAGEFEVVHSAEHEAQGKPDPAVYLSTADRLGVDPRGCIAIEDSVNGVRSAIAAGMRCVAIPAPETRDDPRFAIATSRLDSLEELPQILEGL